MLCAPSQASSLSGLCSSSLDFGLCGGYRSSVTPNTLRMTLSTALGVDETHPADL